MAFEQRDNTGSLFKNEGDKKKERGPDYSGTCMVGGVEYYFDGWIKAAETGRKWMSFSFKPKGQAPQKPAKAPAKPQGGFSDMDSDIPFADPMKGAKAFLA